jgi:flagellar biosynthetic protein FliO
MMMRRGQYVVAIIFALSAVAYAQAPAPNVPTGAADVAAVPAAPAAAPAVAPAVAPAAAPASGIASPAVVPAETSSQPTQAAPSPSGFDRTGIEGREIGRGGSGGRSTSGQTSPRAPDNTSLWWRTLGALTLVIGLILGMRWVLRRTSRMRSSSGSSQVIEVLSRTSISPRQSLLLVRVGQRMLVVGAGETLTTLAEIDDPTQVAELLGSVEQARASSLTNTFARALGQWRSSSVDFAGQLSEVAADQPADGAAGQTLDAADPRTPAAGAADRLRNMAQKVRDVGDSSRRRP